MSRGQPGQPGRFTCCARTHLGRLIPRHQQLDLLVLVLAVCAPQRARHLPRRAAPEAAGHHAGPHDLHVGHMCAASACRSPISIVVGWTHGVRISLAPVFAVAQESGGRPQSRGEGACCMHAHEALGLSRCLCATRKQRQPGANSFSLISFLSAFQPQARSQNCKGANARKPERPPQNPGPPS